MNLMGKEFMNNTIILFIGRICTKMIQFLLLPLYTAVLTTSEYGTIDLITAYVSILIVLVNLQIEQSIFRFLVVERENKIESTRIITNILTISFFQLLFYSIIYCIIQGFINIDCKIFLLLNVFSSIFLTTMLQITRGLGDYKTYAKASFYSSSIVILLNILFLIYFKMSVDGLLLSTFLGYLIGGLYLFFNKKIYAYINMEYIDRKRIKELLGYSIPLIPNELSWQAIKSSDRIIVSHLLGTSYNGILSVATKFSSVYTEVYNIFNASLVDSVITSLQKKDGYLFINKLINKLYLVFSSLAILIVTIMPFIFNIFVDQSYSDAYNYIPLYFIASLINVLVGLISGILVYEKNTILIAKTSFVAGLINIIVDLLLMKYIGLYAAAISTILGFLSMFLIRYLIILKKYPIRIEINNIIFTMLSFILILPIYYSSNIVFKLIALILSIIVIYIYNKEDIKQIAVYIFSIMKKRKNKEVKKI